MGGPQRAHLTFVQLPLRPPRKTPIWQVRAATECDLITGSPVAGEGAAAFAAELDRPDPAGLLLGEIRWYAPWRRYVFAPASATLFDADCLGEVRTFIGGRMREHAVAHRMIRTAVAAERRRQESAP